MHFFSEKGVTRKDAKELDGLKWAATIAHKQVFSYALWIFLKNSAKI